VLQIIAVEKQIKIYFIANFQQEAGKVVRAEMFVTQANY
jgi:hypothetical protein